MPSTTEPIGSRAGRPRDESIENRVIDEALRLFAAVGWAGFSIDRIAKACSVGKASIYLRWDTKLDLLLDALERRIVDVADLDRGSLREDLRHLFDQAVRLYLTPAGLAATRLFLEAESEPALRPRLDGFTRARRAAGLNITRRAVERGELPAGTDPIYIANTIWGAAMLFASSQTPSGRVTAAARAGNYGSWLIDRLLAAETGPGVRAPVRHADQ